jgi:CIC family chloride channel protein
LAGRPLGVPVILTGAMGGRAVPASVRGLWQRFRQAQQDMPSGLMGWSLVVGGLAGLLGGAFRLGLAAVEGERAKVLDALHRIGWMGWVVAVGAGAILVMVARYLVVRFAPEASGSGVQEIEGALEGVRPVRWRRVIPVKFGAGLVALGSGLALGREGPTIQMGGCAGQLIGETRRLPGETQHVLVAAGAGAGLAAAFNAPFAGILFVVEEMRPQFRYSIPSAQAVVLACAASDIVVRLMIGGSATIDMPSLAAPPLPAYGLFLIFGTLFGLFGVAFSRMIMSALDFLDRWPPLAVAAVVGGLTGALAFLDPALAGGGHHVLERALGGGFSLTALLLIFAARFVTTPFNYASGPPGGIFSPMLAIATLFGMAYGQVAHEILPSLVPEPTLFAVAGMGALFAATVRAPLTGIILTAEITGNFGQILPLMVTCVAATIVAHGLGEHPIYASLLRRTLKRDGG